MNKGRVIMEHNIEDLIIDIMKTETKITKAVNSGRGTKTQTNKQIKNLKKISELLGLDFDYLIKHAE